MNARVIHFVGPFSEVCIEIAQSPYRVTLWINRFRDLAHLFGDLGVASQIVHKLSVGLAEEPLDDRSITWLGPGPRGLRTRVVRQERLKVGATEVGASVNHEENGPR